MKKISFASASLEEAVRALAGGETVILCDDEDRENEGDLVCAAAFITPEKINFMTKFGRGLICAPITAQRAEKLGLPLMNPQENTLRSHCNFTVSVDARSGVTTGISAFDRAATVKALLDPKSKPADFVRPGHLFPLIAKDGGVLARTGHTEGSLDLMKLAGLPEVAVICEIMDSDGRMMTGLALRRFAKKHAFPMVTIKDLVAHRKQSEKPVKREVSARLPTTYGEWRMHVYTAAADGKEHVALVMGDISDKKKPPLVRVHSECLTGDLFMSTRCDCNAQMHAALRLISREGCGVFLYMRQEGRGIGLVNKLKAYNLQDEGYDTVTANQRLGFPADLRDYGAAASILSDIGVTDLRLMTNNPKKVVGLEEFGLRIVDRVQLESETDERMRSYLKVKKQKMGHLYKNV